MCIFNDGPFSFLRWFFHFWGKYYNILQMQQKRHTLQYAFDITVLPALFVCRSSRSLLLQLISIVFSQFIFCIFYNHVTMAMHFVCFVFYFVCVPVCVCVYICMGLFSFPSFSTVAILSLFGGQFSILFFHFFFSQLSQCSLYGLDCMHIFMHDQSFALNVDVQCLVVQLVHLFGHMLQHKCLTI